MNRKRVAVLGEHPLLEVTKEYLINHGYDLTTSNIDNNIDFCVLGADFPAAQSPTEKITRLVSFMENPVGLLVHRQDIPVILLSSSSIYGDKEPDARTPLPKKPMTEHDPIVIPSALEVRADRALIASMTEHALLARTGQTLVLRTFNVYGPNLPGVVRTFIEKAKNNESLPVFEPGYQSRCFLYIDDFKTLLDNMLPKFLKGTRGIYNVGSTEETSIKQLGAHVWQLVHGANSKPEYDLVPTVGVQNLWKLPDVTRIQAIARWKPRTSLRRGLWYILNEGT